MCRATAFNDRDHAQVATSTSSSRHVDPIDSSTGRENLKHGYEPEGDDDQDCKQRHMSSVGMVQRRHTTRTKSSDGTTQTESDADNESATAGHPEWPHDHEHGDEHQYECQLTPLTRQRVTHRTGG
jgi:hypothetical protein